jgi:hypothetical protein
MSVPEFMAAPEKRQREILSTKISTIQEHIRKAFKAKYDVYGTEYEKEGDKGVVKVEKEFGIEGMP